MRKAQHGGSGTLYNRGCRCEDCRKAHNERIKNYAHTNPEAIRKTKQRYKETHREQVRGWDNERKRRTKERKKQEEAAVAADVQHTS